MNNEFITDERAIEILKTFSADAKTELEKSLAMLLTFSATVLVRLRTENEYLREQNAHHKRQIQALVLASGEEPTSWNA
jgi:hypothetical protein